MDTATRVFSRPPLPTAADADASDADAGTADTAPEAGSEPGTAVAAGGAGADEGEGEGVEGAAEKAGPDADADPDPDTDAVADAPEGDEEPAADTAADAGPGEPSEAADEAPEGADGASGDSDEDSSEPMSAQESEPEPPTEPERRSAADAEPGGTAEPKPPAEDAAEPEPKPDAVAESKLDAKGLAELRSRLDAEAAESKSDGERAADSKSKPGAETESTAEPEPKPGAGPDTEAEPRSKPDAEAGADSGADTAPDADGTPPPKPPVDQPTAIFKVRPPAAPPVDQPTTMLKLGDAAAKAAKAAEKPTGETGAKDGVGAKGVDGESVAERTSKFVALRQLDDPATRKPPPPAPQPVADATAAIPQVGPERTTQQPLPPLPPLDLLAELTNTPPPPNTAVRTIVRRVKIWTPLVILLAIVFAVVQALRPLPTPELTLTAEDSYTFDGEAAALPWPSEGQGWMDVNGIGTMGKFGEQKPVAIGSVAKAMTAYVILKSHPLKSGEDGPKITVDALAEKEAGYWKDGESTLTTVKTGDVLTEQQAIAAIMIPSANNIARLLARWDSGTETAFIKKMNDTAKELGMTNTTYTDASGLKETTVSSAEDQVKLGNELVRIPALMDITKLPSWVDPSGKKWNNYNRLVPYNGAIGIKTGTTTAAGGNLLFAATKEVGGETVTVVGTILGQHTAPIIDTVNAVSKTAMIAARDALLSSKILKKGDVVGYVDDGLGGHTPVVLSKDVTAVGWAGMKVDLSFAAAADLPHTAKAGTTVGTLTVGDSSGGAVKVPVQLQADLVEPGFDKKLTRVG